MAKLICCYQALYLFLFVLHFQATCSSSPLSFSPRLPKSCLPKESSALLQFKTTFSINNPLSTAECCNPKTDTWKQGTDCCLWDGVTCDGLTGHVIRLDLSCGCLHGSFPSNSTLFQLSQLQRLNLADNDFNFSPIPSQFGLLTKLTHLSLSGSVFLGKIPPEISHLSKMVSLDICLPSGYLELEMHSFEKLSRNLTELRVLHLCGVVLSSVPPRSLLNLSSSLRSLRLQNCFLHGKLPDNFFQFPSLEVLDLSSNKGLTGEIPDSIGSVESLEYLDLNSNNFYGQLPFSLFNLTQLSDLDFSDNQLVGPLPYSISQSALPRLNRLFLSHNLLNGRIPSWLLTLPSLKQLNLQNNLLTGPIDQFQQNSSLLIVHLENNLIHGPIPSSIFEVKSLLELYLSFNNFSGFIKWNMLQELKNLHELDLSHNIELSSTTSSIVNFTMPNLESLILSACNISKFPNFLRNLENLRLLDLSNNRIHGQIFTNESNGWAMLTDLDLSNNFLTWLDQHPWNNIAVLDLSYNFLQGPLLAPPVSTLTFLISNNKHSGAIPSSLCNASALRVLDLSNSDLSGVTPLCLGNFSYFLLALNLRNNNFQGSIMGTFGECDSLNYLDLSGNQFEGPIPGSLVHCGSLEVLNLGNNKINDTFPHWLETLPYLKVLFLRSNNFHGNIGQPKTEFPFPQLRILDLSHNKFTGNLPMKYLQNLKFFINMDGVANGSKYIEEWFAAYHYQRKTVYARLNVTMKGLEIEMTKIQNIYTSIDMSENQFHGEIPESIGMLRSLRLLNFSHNSLTGRIPSSLGNMSALESVDLSSNKLVGEIPSQLTSLTFLAVLNLSNNQLRGPIPLGKQFGTFSNDSYIGNLGLCGVPLSKKCSNAEPSELPSARFNREEDESAGWFDRKIAAMGYSCGLVIGLSMGYIVFATGRPQWFVGMVERKLNTKLRRSNPRCRGRRH